MQLSTTYGLVFNQPDCVVLSQGKNAEMQSKKTGWIRHSIFQANESQILFSGVDGPSQGWKK